MIWLINLKPRLDLLIPTGGQMLILDVMSLNGSMHEKTPNNIHRLYFDNLQVCRVQNFTDFFSLIINFKSLKELLGDVLPSLQISGH